MIALDILLVTLAAIGAREYGINGEFFPAVGMVAVAAFGAVKTAQDIAEEANRMCPAPKLD